MGLVFFAALLGLAACETQPPMTTKTLQQPSQVTQTIRMGEYRVAPGDKIRVVVLSDTELSGDYEVDSTGLISPRMAGRMSVVGMTTVEIESMLRNRYRTDGFLRDPKLSVDLVSPPPVLRRGRGHEEWRVPVRERHQRHSGRRHCRRLYPPGVQDADHREALQFTAARKRRLQRIVPSARETSFPSPSGGSSSVASVCSGRAVWGRVLTGEKHRNRPWDGRVGSVGYSARHVACGVWLDGIDV